jgi:DNA polymerase-3 subunit epsilon
MSFPPSDEQFNLERSAELLEASGLYRVLRKLPPLNVRKHEIKPDERVVAIVDTETTGLDLNQDEVIEISGIKIAYDSQGNFSGLISTFSQLQEPRARLNADVIRLTGLTMTTLKGQAIDRAGLAKFIEEADLIVAHNAAFDRPFCERLSDVFQKKPWACSATEIDWKAYGFNGARLTDLLSQAGWFYEAHRALDDCNALIQILGTKFNEHRNTPFQDLLISARQTKTRLSFSASFSSRAVLRGKGFRWKPGDSKASGKWYIDLSEEAIEPTLTWLITDLRVNEAQISFHQMTAFDRYRLQSE